MKKTTFIILVILAITLILTACATPPTPTPIPTATLAPPTQTPLPPTPDLDDILPSEVSEEYTLRTDNNEIFYLQDKDGNLFPEISIDIDGNIFFGEENTPANLEIKNEELLITQGDKTLLFTGEGWANIPNQLPEDFTNDWVITAESIIDKDRVVKYELDTDSMEWKKAIKQFILFPDIRRYDENFIPKEELENGNYRKWCETLVTVVDFDLSKVKTPELTPTGISITDDPNTAPNFNDPDTAYFKRNITFGYTEFTLESGEVFRYIVMPIFYLYEGKIYVVITLNPLHRSDANITTEKTQNRIDIWENNMNITAIVPSAKIPFANETDPFIAQTFNDESLNMSQRIKDFVNGDLSALSQSYKETGNEIILLNMITNHEWMR